MVFYKISNFLYENNYVKHVDFACREKYDHLTAKMKGIAHYHFNPAEKFGNVLITPLAKTGERAKRSSFTRTWIVLGAIAAIPASLGVLLKKIGEAFNSKNSLRKQAILQINQMQENHIFLPMKIAAEGFRQLEDSTKLSNEISEFLNKDNAKIKNFEAIFNNYKNALKSNNNIDEYEKAIDEFFVLNPELGEKAKKFAIDFEAWFKKTTNPFSETPEMIKYKAILAEMDKK